MNKDAEIEKLNAMNNSYQVAHNHFSTMTKFEISKQQSKKKATQAKVPMTIN